MLVQQFQPQLIRPPVLVRPAEAGNVVERALCFGCHGYLLWLFELHDQHRAQIPINQIDYLYFNDKFYLSCGFTIFTAEQPLGHRRPVTKVCGAKSWRDPFLCYGL